MSVEKKFDIINAIAIVISIILAIVIAVTQNHWADVYAYRETAEAAIIAIQNLAIL